MELVSDVQVPGRWSVLILKGYKVYRGAISNVDTINAGEPSWFRYRRSIQVVRCLSVRTLAQLPIIPRSKPEIQLRSQGLGWATGMSLGGRGNFDTVGAYALFWVAPKTELSAIGKSVLGVRFSRWAYKGSLQNFHASIDKWICTSVLYLNRKSTSKSINFLLIVIDVDWREPRQVLDFEFGFRIRELILKPPRGSPDRFYLKSRSTWRRGSLHKGGISLHDCIASPQMHAVSRASVNTDFLSGGGKEGRRLYVAGGKALRKDRIGIQKKCSSAFLSPRRPTSTSLTIGQTLQLS